MVKKLSGWNKIDVKGVQHGFQRELEFSVKPVVRRELEKILIETQESFLRDLPDHETPTMPFITGNLHDSIASVVSSGGRVVKASYTDPAARTISPRSGKSIYNPTSGMGYKRIIGSEAAFRMVRSMQGLYPGNVAITMFVAVPYALRPNEKGPHSGYLDNLRDLFSYAMQNEFRMAAAKHIIAVKGNLDQYIQIAYDPEDARIASESGRRRKKSDGYMGSSRPGMSMKIL